MTTSPTLTITLPGGIRPAPICIHCSACDEQMEEKENVNQNPKSPTFNSEQCLFLFSTDEARRLYEHFVSLARKRDVKVETGEFGAMMEVDLVNDGPVTIILDSREK